MLLQGIIGDGFKLFEERLLSVLIIDWQNFREVRCECIIRLSKKLVKGAEALTLIYLMFEIVIV